MEREFVLTRKDESILILTVNRPKALNALNVGVMREVVSVMEEVKRDETVEAVVVTGSGEKAFVAGADIKQMVSLTAKEGSDFAREGAGFVEAIDQVGKPVIAAVNGFALGGGFELALACDFIYAAENAKFGFPEVTLGVIPGFGGSQTLPRLIGTNRAKELILTGKMISAVEAENWGIANAVVPQEELMEKAIATAKQIAKNGGVAIGYALDAINHGFDLSLSDGLRLESGLFGNLFSTEDLKEGMTAFIEKRKANFKNK